MAKAKGPFKPKEETSILQPPEDTPATVKAFAVKKDDKGQWYFIEYMFNGADEMINKTVSGPTMRAIVLDEFKIEAQRYFEMLG